MVRLRTEEPLRAGDDPRARWGLVAQFPAPLMACPLRERVSVFQGRGELRDKPTTRRGSGVDRTAPLGR
ncbi:hypothetical protein SBRY_10129 [Actinacidiphila bryophytorum]|uniref:Uncharacterized protein n=1 Tax=Actinacidiphila bryophytorum TaxID=1436133 RepID=A0A9W4DY54_9ACTN|nr:hypothetical protein SBRY_10129 [Actinacidiphila bryophytorum]